MTSTPLAARVTRNCGKLFGADCKNWVAKKKPGAGPGSSYALLGATTRLGIWPRRARLSCRMLAAFHPLGGVRVFTLCSHNQMGHVEDDLPFRVEQWDASGARLEQTL